jgi:hypothetical protein
MIDYYKYLMIRRDSNIQTIKSALEMAYQRLRQRGESDEEINVLRQAEEIFFDPIKRAAYDGKLETEQPSKREHKFEHAQGGKKTIIAAVILLVVLLAVLFIYLPRQIKGEVRPVINPGVYLISNSTGEQNAALRRFEAEHLFPDGKNGKGYEIIHLDSNEADWVTEEEIVSKYKAGPYAPRSVMGN